MAKCFVIMPISTPKPLIETYKDPDHFAHVLQYLFKPALEEADYEVIPPSAAGADIIHASIVKSLEEADLVLCDISTLNPNVFFELGIRTSLDRPVALVRDNFTLNIPFDTSSINTHTYDASLALWSIEPEVSKLAGYINEATAQAGGRNSMWRVFGITQRAKPAEIENPTAAKLDLLMTQVGQLVKQIEGNQSYAYGAAAGHFPIFYGGSVPSYSFTNLTPTTVQGNPTLSSAATSLASYGFSAGTAQTTSPYSNLINPAPAKFNDFIQRAKAIAATESASLTVVGYDSAEDAVVLSSGGWRLSDDNIRKIDRLAGSLRVEFRLLLTPQ